MGNKVDIELWRPNAQTTVEIELYHNDMDDYWVATQPHSDYIMGNGDTREIAIEEFKKTWIAGEKLAKGIRSGEIFDRYDLIEAALDERDKAVEAHPTHPNVSFTCCRIAEEVGELIQAATSTSRGRSNNRRDAMRLEARQAIAMIIRLMEQWPDGLVDREDG